MFINFSNHSSALWTERQLSATETWGKVVDLPFPTINETGDERYITQLVGVFLQKILDMHKGIPSTSVVIHIMGEMTFTYAMVNALKANGYTCVASTTKRIVEELPNGEKRVKFEFGRFREYR